VPKCGRELPDLIGSHLVLFEAHLHSRTALQILAMLWAATSADNVNILWPANALSRVAILPKRRSDAKLARGITS
jgi:hypothetical protein